MFNEERWKTIPWQGRVKSAGDTIIDILLELPAILADLDSLDDLSLDDPRFDDLKLEAVTKCWEVHGKLDAWIAENSHEVFVPDMEAPVPLVFRNMDVAMLSIRYWATETMLYQSLDRALRYSANETLPPYIDRPHGRPFARLIVRSVSWFFKKEHGVAGPSAVLFPLGISLLFLRQSEVPDPEYLNMVFEIWNDPDWPRSVKAFLKSMSKSINMPTRIIPENNITWSTSEIRPMYDIDGNILSGPYVNPSRFQRV